jgi:ligand-binding SRPBCC domain-containing protein
MSRRPWLVRETSPLYEGEGSEQRSLGSVSIPPDAQWMATLTVPIPERQVVFLEVERRGPLPAGYRGGVEAAHLFVPMGEVTALVALLTGVVAHARHDRVLPSQRGGTHAE